MAVGDLGRGAGFARRRGRFRNGQFCNDITPLGVMTYKPGDRVYRVQEFMPTGALVIDSIDTDWGEVVYLSYDEGGHGWWPADAVTTDRME